MLKKDEISKWSGWIASAIMIVGWSFSFGIFYNRMTSLEEEVRTTNTKIEKVQDAILKQQEINGKILTYIELTNRDK